MNLMRRQTLLGELHPEPEDCKYEIVIVGYDMEIGGKSRSTIDLVHDTCEIF